MNRLTRRFAANVLVVFAMSLPATGSLGREAALAAPSAGACGTWTQDTDTNAVLALDRSPEGLLWAATRGGVVRWDPAARSSTIYTAADGLPGNWAVAVEAVLDRDVWAATRHGVAHFDGRTWSDRDEGLGGVRVLGIAVGTDESIWAISDGSYVLHTYKEDRWREVYVRELGTYGKVDIAVAADGGVWVATTGGLLRWDPATESAVLFDMASGLPSNQVKSVVAVRGSEIWAGTVGGVVRRLDGKWTTYDTRDGLADDYVAAVADDPIGGVWALTRTGLSHFDGTRWSTFPMSATWPPGEILSIAGATERIAFAGLPDGLGRFSNGAWDIWRTAGQIANNSVNEILADDAATLWAATNGGVSMTRGGSWTSYSVADGLPSALVLSVDAWSSAIWAGTNLGPAELADGRWEPAGHRPAERIEDIAGQEGGELWLATFQNGASAFDGRSWRDFGPRDGLASSATDAVAIDDSGVVWIGTDNGISRYDGRTWSTFRSVDGLAGDAVKDVTIAPDGAVWVATSGGVSRFTDGRWTSYRKSDGLIHAAATSVAADTDGSMWFGTLGGLSHLRGGVWTSFTVREGLGDNVVNDVVVDGDGTVRVATLAGVSSLARSRMAPCTASIHLPLAMRWR